MVGAFRHALRREVDGVVIAVAAKRADAFETLQIGDGLARHELRGHDRRIGRDHRVLAKTALQA